MDQATPPQPTPHLPRYRRAVARTVPVVIRTRDLLLLKTIYEFPYCTAAQLSRLLPAGVVNPQLRAYHEQRHQERMTVTPVGESPAKVRRAMLRRLMQLFHAQGALGP